MLTQNFTINYEKAGVGAHSATLPLIKKNSH